MAQDNSTTPKKTRRNYAKPLGAARRLLVAGILEGNARATEQGVDALLQVITGWNDQPDLLRHRITLLLDEVTSDVRRSARLWARFSDGTPPRRRAEGLHRVESLAEPGTGGNPADFDELLRKSRALKREHPDQWPMRNPTTLRGVMLATMTYVYAEVPASCRDRLGAVDYSADLPLLKCERRDLMKETEALPRRALNDYRAVDLLPHLGN